MSLVQIVKVEGEIKRVPKGETPIIELYLTDDRRVVNVEKLQVSGFDGKWSRKYDDRVTYDWEYTIYVEWRVGAST